MADNVLEPYTFSFGDANPASNGCSSRVWVFPTSVLQRKRSRCIYVCIACGCYEASQRASQIWKSFCKSDRPFSSSTWSGRLFSASRASWYQLAIFWICFLQIRLQKHLLGFAQTQYSAQNCAGYASSLTLNKQIFLEKKLFQKNRHWFIQYCIKPKLLLPVLKVKSGSIPSGFSLGFS